MLCVGIVSQMGVATVYTWDIGETKISAAMTRATHNKAQVQCYVMEGGDSGMKLHWYPKSYNLILIHMGHWRD